MPARLRLNLFSPLPPQPSDVGDNTLMVAAALSELAEVTLWTPHATSPGTDHAEPVLETQGGLRLTLPVVQFDPARMDWPRLHQADAQVYHIGNNSQFHHAIFEVAAQAPGIMVLHDTRLQHFFAWQALTEGPARQDYLARLRRSHGAAALADAARWLAGKEPFDTLVERYPMTAAAADAALAVIVHNGAEWPQLAKATRTPVFYLPLAYAAAPPRSRAAPGATLRLVAFGYLGPNRRLATLLEVLAGLPDQDVRLDIYGLVETPAAIDEQVAALRLTGRVTRHGFVPGEVLSAALARADLAINLRYPSMGEASGSQLRIWEAALAAVVTRTGWYATLPEDTVLFVEPEHEAADLRAHLAALRNEPERFREIGRRGRALLERDHTPQAYATQLLQVAAQTPALHARRAALQASRRAARAMLGLAGTEGIALCAAETAAAAAALSGVAAITDPSRRP